MTRPSLDVHIGRIDLAAMPADGERRLREAIAREVARRTLPSAAPQTIATGCEGSVTLGARIVEGIEQAMPKKALR